MTRRIFCKVLLVVVAIFGVLVLSSVLSAQGRSDWALEHVKEVQERNTDRLMAMDGVEGTAIGFNQNDQLSVKVFTAGPGVRGIPQELEGVPVQVVVTGKFYALAPGGKGARPAKDSDPPAAPTDLGATVVSSSQIDLDWGDNIEPDLRGYNVYRSDTSGDSYSQIATRVRSSDYSDTGLAAGTTYYYVVTAVDRSKNESENSNEALATTEGGPVEPPLAPTGLMATAVSSSQIDLSWTDNADNENGFKIERNSVQIDMVGANVTSYSDTGLDPSTTYTYRVRAYNDAGNSAYTDETSATTEPPPDKPPLWCERPVPIGVSTGHPDITAGTIGCRVIDASGNVYALSNNHVYANENKASIGDNVLQPGTFDGGVNPDDKIGTLADFEPINFHPRASNTIDAAVALTSTDMVGNATPSNDPDYPDGYGTPSSTTATAYVGLEVQKYGRNGHTYGNVTGINATVRVGYSTRSAIFVEQIIIEPGGFSAGGDSGSLVVTQNGKNPVGLLFAGSSTMTVANPIDAVLTRFGVTVDGE